MKKLIFAVGTFLFAANAMADDANNSKDTKNEGLELVVHQPVMAFTPASVSALCYYVNQSVNEPQRLQLQLTLSADTTPELFKAMIANDQKPMAFTYNGKTISNLRGRTRYSGDAGPFSMEPKEMNLLLSTSSQVSVLELMDIAHALSPKNKPGPCEPYDENQLEEGLQNYFDQKWQ